MPIYNIPPSPALATSATPGAMPFLNRDIGIVSIGDSHTEGKITWSADDTAPTNLNPYLRQKDWTGTADNAYPRTKNAIFDKTNSWDPNTVGRDDAAGSWTSLLAPALIQQFSPAIRNVRVANLGNGGSCVYTWAGRAASMYFHFTGVPTAGETVSVGGVTYTFRATWASANDVAIQGTAGATAQWLMNVISGVSGYGSDPNPLVYCPNPSASAYSAVFALVTGTAGNAIACSTASSSVQCCDPGTLAAGVTHLSLGAATSSMITDNLVTLIPAGFGSVDIVTVTLGTNDVARIGYRARGFATDAANLLALLHQTYPTAKIVMWLPPKRSLAADNTTLSTIAIPALQTLQAANPTLLYLCDAFNLDAGSGDTTLLSGDGVHWTDYGYRYKAPALFATAIGRALGL